MRTFCFPLSHLRTTSRVAAEFECLIGLDWQIGVGSGDNQSTACQMILHQASEHRLAVAVER